MQRARATLRFLLFFVLSLAALSALRERDFEDRLGSDEPEWIAASILHWNQLFRGAPPAGADLRPPEGGRGPWEQGFQHTTFGYMNPCLPKLIWGGLLAAAGHTEASPYAFQTFHKGDPALGQAAYQALLEPMPLVRRSVLWLAALSGALTACVAAATCAGASRAARLAASLVALALFVASPLVRSTATYIRTDHFMLPFVLALWWWGLARRRELAGGRGLRAAVAAGLVAGVLGGLATSSKLNGALGLFALAGAALTAWASEGRDRPSPALPLAGLATAAASSLLVFFLLNPRLWSGPLAGVEDILARWDKLMGYFQDEWAPRTGVAVARTRAESLGLFLERTLERDGPLAALAGLRADGLWMGLGLAALAAAALGQRPLGAPRAVRSIDPAIATDASRTAARVSLAFVLALALGTALWLPLDWERLFLPAVPVFAVLGGVLAASCVALLARART